MEYRHKDGVTFKKLAFSQLDMIHRLKNESWWGTHQSLVLNSEDVIRWFNDLPKTSLILVGHVNQVTPAGICCLTNIDPVSRTMDISGSVLEQYRAEFAVAGFTAGVDFAFEMLNAHRLTGEVLETNSGPLTIDMKVLGFRYEGRKRQAVYKCGRYYDSIVLGLLREEWESQARVKAYGGSCNKTWDLAVVEKAIGFSAKRCPVLPQKVQTLVPTVDEPVDRE